MTIRESIVRCGYKHAGGVCFDNEQIDQALNQIAEVVGGMKREIGEMRYGGCNPDEDRGYNQAISDIAKKIRGGV